MSDVCKNCGRPFATRSDFEALALEGKCPARYAYRDHNALDDCRNVAAARRGLAEQALDSLTSQLAAVTAERDALLSENQAWREGRASIAYDDGREVLHVLHKGMKFMKEGE